MPKYLKINTDFSDYIIYGLSTHMKDYKLCWLINTKLLLNLKRHLDVKVEETNRTYCIYLDDTNEHLCLYIVANTSESIPWFIQGKHFHYFFVINGSPLSSTLKNIEQGLKSIEQILLVTKLNSEEKKLAVPLLSNLELHVTKANYEEKMKQKKLLPKTAGIKKLRNLKM